MANLINATVYQIDGNPQKDVITVAFDTNKIRLQETTLSTIPEVNTFIEVQGEKLNAPVVKYFVSETVSTLVAAANTGGTTLLQATVVAINENPFKTSLQMAFPANKVTVWEFISGTINSFLQFNEDKFYATQSKATLLAAANAGGISGADNGLSISGTEVVLGGKLINNTSIDGNEESFSIDFSFLNEFNVFNTNAIKLGLGSPSGIWIQGSQTVIGDWDGWSNATVFGVDDSAGSLICSNITSETIGDAITGWIKIIIDGTPRVIPFYNLA
jgi:hypothetical protein